MATGLGIVENGKLQGYGVLRPCHLGYKIGPLFADDPEMAEILFGGLRAHVEKDAPVFLDTPEVNQQAVDLAERHGMTVCSKRPGCIPARSQTCL